MCPQGRGGSSPFFGTKKSRDNSVPSRQVSEPKHVLAMTFMARRRAYARLCAVPGIPGSRFLSNTWRVDRGRNIHDAAMRTMWGFVSVIGNNAFKESWPDIKTHLFQKKE